MSVPNPEDYAIVVGVDHYGDGINSLQGCRNDAQLFYDWLIDPKGGGLNATAPQNGAPPNVVLIQSPERRDVNPPRKPDRNDVEDALLRLAEWSPSCPNGRVGRRLYLWFASHGVAVENKLDECAALMADARSSALNRSIPGREAADNFRGVAMFDEIVLLMSCCRTVVTGSTKTALSFPLRPSPSLAASVRCLYGFAAMWAATAMELQLSPPLQPDSPTICQSAFAHALIKGLVHAVDDDGNVTSESLANYVKAEVPKLLPPGNNLAPDIAPIGKQIMFRIGTEVDVNLTLTTPAVGFAVLRAKGLTPVPVTAVVVSATVRRIRLQPGAYVFNSPQGAIVTHVVTEGGPNDVVL